MILLAMSLALLGFGYYCWVGTKIRDTRGTAGQRDVLVPEIKIENEGNSVLARFSLTNTGPAPMRVLDTLNLEPLYSFRVEYCAPESKTFEPVMPTPEKISLDRKGGEKGNAYNPARDIVVILAPGRSLVVPVQLSLYYDVRRPGKYELTFSYATEAMSEATPLKEWNELEVSERNYNSLKASFELPFVDPRKPVAAPPLKPPAVPATATQNPVPPAPPARNNSNGKGSTGDQNVFD